MGNLIFNSHFYAKIYGQEQANSFTKQEIEQHLAFCLREINKPENNTRQLMEQNKNRYLTSIMENDRGKLSIIITGNDLIDEDLAMNNMYDLATRINVILKEYAQFPQGEWRTVERTLYEPPTYYTLEIMPPDAKYEWDYYHFHEKEFDFLAKMPAIIALLKEQQQEIARLKEVKGA